MARTIAEIQNEILVEKGKQATLSGLTNDSNTSIWKLWTNIVATAIWLHEKIVERNALISRPHTLEWYKAQVLKFLKGRDLIFKDGFFEFDTLGLTDENKEEIRIVKYCAVSEVDLDTIVSQNGTLALQNQQTSQEMQTQILSSYFHNQVGVVFMKVAKDEGDFIVPLSSIEQSELKEYIKRIKDAGNQVQIISIPGDLLSIELDVFVDPLIIYVNPDGDQNDVNNGFLIADGKTKPVNEAIISYLKKIEFNGALVKTFLIDAVQKSKGVSIPIFKEFRSGIYSLDEVTDQNTQPLLTEFYIPNAGYFDLEKLKLTINYYPYTFYRNNQNTF